MEQQSLIKCAACGEDFIVISWDEALDEALETFDLKELVGAGVVCHDCWLKMRETTPTFDARFRV